MISAPRADVSGREPRDWMFNASVAFLLVGCALRLAQYCANASQWLDEAMLSSSIASRPLLELLTTPLAYGQSAPPGFLAAQRLAIVVCGPSDMALRFFPFVCGLVTLFACFRIAQKALRGIARPIAMALVATAAPLISFSGQAKQYSSDVACAVVLTLLVLEARQCDLSRRRALMLACAGTVAAWLSNTVPFVLAGLSVALFWWVWTANDEPTRYDKRRWISVVVVWTVASVASLAVAREHVSASQRQALYAYWSTGFMPLPPWRGAALRWPFQVLSQMFGGVESAGLWYPLKQLYTVLLALGCWSFWQRARGVGMILMAPFAVTLLAAAAHLYPFHDRLVLFLVPSALFGATEGISWVATRVARLADPVGPAAALLLTAPTLYPVVGSPPPYRVEDMKPALEYFRAHREPGDRMYVSYGAVVAFRYYGSRFGIDPSEHILGACHYGDPRKQLAALDRLRGNAHAWLLISHALPTYDEPRDLLAYLDAIGRRDGELLSPSRAPAGSRIWPLDTRIYEYDLSDPVRLSRANAATFPVQSESALLIDSDCD